MDRRPPDSHRFGFRGTQKRRPEVHDYNPGNYRSDFDSMPGVLAAQRRLATHHGRIFSAFNSLDLPFSIDALLDFLEDPLRAAGLPENEYGRTVGVILGTIIVAIEADREARMNQ